MRYQTNKNAALLNISGSYLLVEAGIPDVLQRKVKQLNDVGAYIWAQIEEGTDTETIASQIEEEYDVEPQQVEQDMEDFLNWLLHNKLIY